MTSCCPRRRMRWSGATGAIARCKNRSTGYVRKPRSAHAWHSTCGEKPKEQGATKPSTPYMRPVLPKATRYPRYSLEKVLCKPIVVHTPVHASWRNHVDISWAIIPRKVLTPHDFARVEDV